jgi:hypothetical protein
MSSLQFPPADVTVTQNHRERNNKGAPHIDRIFPKYPGIFELACSALEHGLLSEKGLSQSHARRGRWTTNQFGQLVRLSIWPEARLFGDQPLAGHDLATFDNAQHTPMRGPEGSGLFAPMNARTTRRRHHEVTAASSCRSVRRRSERPCAADANAPGGDGAGSAAVPAAASHRSGLGIPSA